MSEAAGDFHWHTTGLEEERASLLVMFLETRFPESTWRISPCMSLARVSHTSIPEPVYLVVLNAMVD